MINGRIDAGASAEMLAGSRVELVLKSDRFLFRPLELPKRAAEFMSGVIRSQIDRLTPWNAEDAAYGWNHAAQTNTDKMVVTIAVTPLTSIKPYVEAIANIGVHSIAVFTGLPDANHDASLVKIWEQGASVAKSTARIRHALVVAFVAVGITTAVAVGADAIVTTNLSGQRDELAHRISVARSAAGALRTSRSGSATKSERALDQRKHDAPSSVLILETLSKILPDQTYVTELRLEGTKVRLTGVTRDAPSLIGLIEQSGHFTRATFFAPTTRAPSAAGDRFHIEAVITTVGPST
jgi:general secretion pathway protein L